MDIREMVALIGECDRVLSGNHPKNQFPKQVLSELAELAPADMLPDNYGEGELIEGFEREVADLLGKEAAVFMPSGTMAQQIALRIWSDRRGTRNVAFHPTCHLEIHEEKGYEMLHHLHGILVGHPDRLMTLGELQRVAEPLGALLLELPQREIGGQLPSWDELSELTGWAREQGIPLHMDGARLWESKPFYGKSYAEIAGLFDTLYVSFYKGLGGISGAALAGPAGFIRESRVWLRRHGGNLMRLYPYVLAARRGLRERLDRMETYHRKALEIAAALTGLDGVELVPNPPHTNMMHVYLRGEAARLEQARAEIAREHRVFLFYKLAPSPIPAYQKFELSVHEGAQELSGEEVRMLFAELMQRAG